MSEQELPALAQEREREAIELAHNVFNAAQALVSNGMLKPIGYRVMVKPMDGIRVLEAAQAEQFPTLAQLEFETKSEAERKRVQRGENHGVMIAMGRAAYNRLGGRDLWCDVGDLVVFARYNGTFVEHPPESGNVYQVLNDEDIFARIE